VGGMTILSNNATAFRRRIARLFDSLLTTPHIRRYYDFLLQYGRDEEKGDVMVKAKGSTALVERDIQSQSLIQMVQLFLNPIYGKDPKKVANQFLKSQKFDPTEFDFEDEEWQQMVENWQQILESQSQDPRLQVEQMRQEGKQAELQFKGQMEQQKQAFEAQENALNRELESIFKQVDAENEQLKEQGKRELTSAQIQARFQEALDKRKTELALNVQKIKSTEKLVGMKASSDQLPKPPVEPPGKAPSGESYQK